MAAKICELLGSGLSLRKICLEEQMPDRVTVFRWLFHNEEFRSQYALAREHWAESVFEEIFDISDDGSKDTYEDEDGKTKTDWEVIGRSKLRVDTRKWALSKLSPKKYGEKLTQEIDLTTRAASLDDAERAKRINVILERAAKRKSEVDDSLV